METDATFELLGEAKRVAVRYRELTGRPLGVTGEVAEYEAARLLVLLDERLEATAIYHADAPAVRRALETPGSRARNERGALSVSKFRSIGRRLWPVDPAGEG